jgi:hypothetical protein
MSILREAAQAVVDAFADPNVRGNLRGRWLHLSDCITELRAALAQQEQEPVTWGVDWGRDGDRPCCTIIKRHADGTQEVVAVEYGPPRREWQGLTEDDVRSLYGKDLNYRDGDYERYARAIEQACKERNT